MNALKTLGIAFAVVLAFLLGCMAIMPVISATGRVWVYYFGTPKITLPQFGPHQNPPAYIPNQGLREVFLKKQPSKPTKEAEVVPWEAVYGMQGPMTELLPDGRLRVTELSEQIFIYHDRGKKWSWTLKEELPVTRGGEKPPR